MSKNMQINANGFFKKTKPVTTGLPKFEKIQHKIYKKKKEQFALEHHLFFITLELDPIAMRNSRRQCSQSACSLQYNGQGIILCRDCPQKRINEMIKANQAKQIHDHCQYQNFGRLCRFCIRQFHIKLWQGHVWEYRDYGQPTTPCKQYLDDNFRGFGIRFAIKSLYKKRRFGQKLIKKSKTIAISSKQTQKVVE